MEKLYRKNGKKYEEFGISGLTAGFHGPAYSHGYYLVICKPGTTTTIRISDLDIVDNSVRSLMDMVSEKELSDRIVDAFHDFFKDLDNKEGSQKSYSRAELADFVAQYIYRAF